MVPTFFFAEAPDSVYVVIDTRHPDLCKVGASKGTCNDRLVEANRWTANSCEVRFTKHCGSGKGFAFEARIHMKLEALFGEPRGEWFNCSGDNALRTIEALAETLNRV